MAQRSARRRSPGRAGDRLAAATEVRLPVARRGGSPEGLSSHGRVVLGAIREYLDQVTRAAATDLYYLTLEATLVIPDMCAGLEAPDGGASPRLYVAWFDAWVAPRYVGAGPPSFSGEDCYGLRCAMLHQGRLSPHKGSFRRVMFVEPHGRRVSHNNAFRDGLTLDVTWFAADMIECAEQWLVQAEETETCRANFPKFMQRYPQGLYPYIVGLPAIA